VSASLRRKPRAAGKSRAGGKARTVDAVHPEVAAVKEPFQLKLDAGCTLRDCADMQFSLVAADGDPVVVDGSAVERIDTAGLQLLVALARRQRDAGRGLSWQSASPELLRCGRRLGLIDALGLSALADGGSP
jgi:ABC-type transporter Mla MlaB component